MSVSGFLTALLHACLGFAAGNTLRRELGAGNGPRAEGPAAEPAPRGMSRAQADELLERIEELAASELAPAGCPVRRAEGSAAAPWEAPAFGSISPAAELLEFSHRLQVDLASVKAELQTQRNELVSYKNAALTDSLTGLANRRRFDDELQRRFTQWKDSGAPLTLVLVDVDHFKKFNDDYGHQTGDAVLHEVAQVLAANVRDRDVVARYGGEEFALIFPATTLEEARPVAERVRSAVGQRSFGHTGHELHVTVSAGIAAAAFSNDPEVLVTRADMALYAAKDAGRNCCYVHDGQECVPLSP